MEKMVSPFFQIQEARNSVILNGVSSETKESLIAVIWNSREINAF
jgi:hypothetical protein